MSAAVLNSDLLGVGIKMLPLRTLPTSLVIHKAKQD